MQNETKKQGDFTRSNRETPDTRGSFCMKDDSRKIARVGLRRVLRALWHKIWIVGIAAVVCAAIAFSVSVLFIAPRYEATTMLYVANSSISFSSTTLSISSADLTAAQSLVKTYLVVLNSRSTLETVIQEAEVDYSYEQLQDMISAGAVNETEIFQVTVTSRDPKEAKRIANAVAVVLLAKIPDIIDGSSVRVVDYAVTPAERSYPNVFVHGLVGLALGAVVSTLVIILLELSDTTVRSESYLAQVYADVPILAVIPNTQESGGGYYSSYRRASRQERGAKR